SWLLFRDPKSQKRLTDNDLVAVFQWMPISWRQASPAIDERAISRSQILNQVMAIANYDARVAAGHFCLRIVRIQIDVGKHTAVRIPAANIRFRITQTEFLAGRN